MTSSAFAELLFDTARAPAELGTRGASCGERHMLFRHCGVQVDLLVQTAGRAGVFVWGQAAHALSGRPLVDAAVRFREAGARTISATRTDRFGEFRLAAPRGAEGAIEVESPAGPFACWIAPGETSEATA